MAEDLKFELAILATVQGFYQKLMRDSLGGDVPIPSGLDEVSLRHADDDLPETLSRMYRWLHLLDMAITPAMLRQALTPETDSEVAEALLRYFVRRREPSEVNRDKTDLISTFLYRHPRVHGQWQQHGYGLDGSLPLSPFEIALIEILADTDVPSLPEEHVQLLRNFDPLREEIARYRDFNSLMDSGIVSRVRELKRWLDSSFYHPGVLATVAAHNAAFGARFDQLFAKALGEIKQFAQALDEMGGSILSTVDGVEVTVEHVAAIEQKEMLQADYGGALEKFRRVSHLKKELDRRPPIRKSLLAPAAGQKAHPICKRRGRGRQTRARCRRKSARRGSGVPAAGHHSAADFLEEGKLRRVEESIRVFVRVADPKYRQIVPMRFFNLTLTAPEAEAYNASFLEEKSLRADVARSPDPPGFLRGAHQHRTRRTQAQPEHVVSVEAACRRAGSLARDRQHHYRRRRRGCQDSRSQRRRLRQSYPRNHAETARPLRSGREGSGPSRELEAVRSFPNPITNRPDYKLSSELQVAPRTEGSWFPSA